LTLTERQVLGTLRRMRNARDAEWPQRNRNAESSAFGAVGILIVLGLYLTFRGYHSLDGDQAYRLPLLLHQQDPSLYATDPFVRAFDDFNPHRGSLVILGGAASLLGLSPALFLIFGLTFLATYCGIDRLAGAVWPRAGRRAGLAAVILVLAAKAGNIGTNHLFEAMVLDRLMAMALVWLALASIVGHPDRGWRPAALALGGAALIHPSLGLQASLAVVASWGLWALLGSRTQVGWKTAWRGMLATGLALIPGLVFNLGSGGSLLNGLPPADFWVLAVELQSPQHMLPHLWRMPQWLAWASYLLLAGMALARIPGELLAPGQSHPPNPPFARGGKDWGPASRVRLALMLAVVLASLSAAWMAIEVLHNLRITIFQPFRMATVARGLALVFIAGRLLELWERGEWFPRLRSVLIGVALAGDWMLVVVTIAEIGVAVCETLADRPLKGRFAFVPHLEKAVYAALLAFGLVFLSRHDTESGHWPLLAVLGVGLAAAFSTRWATRAGRRSVGECEAPAERAQTWPRHAPVGALALAWVVPIAALFAGLVPADHPAARWPLVQGLVARCRFAATPIDDVERLANWCRRHTPAAARFIGPPGPKTFRLWSRRSLAFNRAGSPYHAAGLADWFRRFQDHVGVHEPPAAFVRDYLAGRHSFEARYDQLDDEEQAALAFRQGAEYVIALSPSAGKLAGGSARKRPMELLHTEGRYAVYKVNRELLSHRQ
jgi:hypothetical protein